MLHSQFQKESSNAVYTMSINLYYLLFTNKNKWKWQTYFINIVGNQKQISANLDQYHEYYH